MDDNSEIRIKQICCTCLSLDRKLYQLCRLKHGVNNLYLLLSFDSEAYREGFYKDTASLFICWECQAIMNRISMFRQQACTAQRRLTSLADGRINIKSPISLSHLSIHHKTTYDQILTGMDNLTDNFIDCGSNTDLKESEEDIPLSELNTNWQTEEQTIKKNKNKKRKKIKKQYFSTASMNELELKEVLSVKRSSLEFVGSNFKCDSCVEVFKDGVDLDQHNLDFHVEKSDHIQCELCLAFIKEVIYQDHRDSHYRVYSCLCCDYVGYNLLDIVNHLDKVHKIEKNSNKKKKGRRKLDMLTSESEVTTSLLKKRSFEYHCKECNKCFDNKNQRWKHVQRHHREGYKCSTCSKRFAFKNNLARHEQLHKGPLPRTECEICHKMIRIDLLKVHSRIHTDRQQYNCTECAKSFVSRASYEHHLKYTNAHAAVDVLKYKCSQCDKGYRSRGELRDHVNYQHMGKTQHKCPVCGKALATRRCITRHVRRAHDGVKESARDKICQQCGKAFRDKKGLREHELIHTGERPLSCEFCGCTFRQSASLYTHRKRVHKIYPQTKTIQLLT